MQIFSKSRPKAIDLVFVLQLEILFADKRVRTFRIITIEALEQRCSGIGKCCKQYRCRSPALPTCRRSYIAVIVIQCEISGRSRRNLRTSQGRKEIAVVAAVGGRIGRYSVRTTTDCCIHGAELLAMVLPLKSAIRRIHCLQSGWCDRFRIDGRLLQRPVTSF